MEVRALRRYVREGRVSTIWLEGGSSGAFLLVAIVGLFADCEQPLPERILTLQDSSAPTPRTVELQEEERRELLHIWRALTSPTADSLAKVLMRQLTLGSWSTMALGLHLGQIPSRSDGLCFWQRAALQLHGRSLETQLKCLLGSAGEAPGFTWFDLADLITPMMRGTQPLFQGFSGSKLLSQPLSLTKVGRAVLEGREAWIGARRWIGGLLHDPLRGRPIWLDDLREAGEGPK